MSRMNNINQITVRDEQIGGQVERQMSQIRFQVKDPMSALTHLLGFIGAILLTPILLIHASNEGAGTVEMASLSIFMISMITLYAASTSYHTFTLSAKGNQILKKFDHMAIYVLIAGSYTPVCVMLLQGMKSPAMLMLVWGVALAGLGVTYFWVNCPKWVSSIIYICMGWLCVLVFPDIVRGLPLNCFLWLLFGGILYTVGGVIYALKLTAFNSKNVNFGSHEIFHCFVLAGSLCHFICMYQWI